MGYNSLFGGDWNSITTISPKPKAKKVEGLDYHFSGTENKSVWSHCVVTSNFI